MVYLGLDYGSKRIGVAKSDELGVIAEAVGYLDAGGREKVQSHIKDLVDQFRVKCIVIGLPITTKGEVGVEAEKVLKFADHLKQAVNCEVVTWDERFTTQSADRIFRETEVSFTKRKHKRDALAAQIMLQNYLEFKRTGNRNVSIE